MLTNFLAVEITRDIVRHHGASIATVVITYLVLSLLLGVHPHSLHDRWSTNTRSLNSDGLVRLS